MSKFLYMKNSPGCAGGYSSKLDSSNTKIDLCYTVDQISKITPDNQDLVKDMNAQGLKSLMLTDGGNRYSLYSKQDCTMESVQIQFAEPINCVSPLWPWSFWFTNE